MRLRQFHAARLPEAMAQVRAALGEDAVILGHRRTARGVEVTAALEAAEPLLILPDVAPAPPLPEPPGPTAFAWHGLPLAVAHPGGDAVAQLAARLRFGPLPDGRARPLLLAGPPGAGKTLTCAKLLTRHVLAGAAPLAITTDGARAGAVEQLAAFTRVLGLKLAVATEPATLVTALARRPNGQPVLIDTAGCDPFVPEEARALLALARAADADILLVLPAGLDTQEAAELARGFALFGARHLLPTRLDRARRLGGVVAAAAAGLALTEAGIGPGAADGLVTVTPEWLVERLLRRADEASVPNGQAA